MNDFTLIFMHIPKCAGTTMMDVLQRNYGEGFLRLDNVDGWKRIEQIPANVRCLAGHFPYGIHEKVMGDYKYATFLRDPAERLLSLYYYIRSRPAHRLHEQAMHLGLSQFIESRIISDTDNGMVRFLAGRHDCGINPPGERIKAPVYLTALEHLCDFDFIGLVEDFDASLVAMAARYGWKDISYTRKLSNPHRAQIEDVSRTDHLSIDYWTYFDNRLYQDADFLSDPDPYKERI